MQEYDFNAIIGNARSVGVPEDVIADMELDMECGCIDEDTLTMPLWAGNTYEGREILLLNTKIVPLPQLPKSLLKEVIKLDSIKAFFECTDRLFENRAWEKINGKWVKLPKGALNPTNKNVDGHLVSYLLVTFFQEFIRDDSALELADYFFVLQKGLPFDECVDATGVVSHYRERSVLLLALAQLRVLLHTLALYLSLIIKSDSAPTWEPERTSKLPTPPPLQLRPQIAPRSPNIAA
jgi:hypothetical protein